MLHYRHYFNSQLSRMTATDVGLEYGIDWLLVGQGYHDACFIIQEV
jgi:hypothetical protein